MPVGRKPVEETAAIQRWWTAGFSRVVDSTGGGDCKFLFNCWKFKIECAESTPRALCGGRRRLCSRATRSSPLFSSQLDVHKPRSGCPFRWLSLDVQQAAVRPQQTLWWSDHPSAVSLAARRPSRRPGQAPAGAELSGFHGADRQALLCLRPVDACLRLGRAAPDLWRLSTAREPASPAIYELKPVRGARPQRELRA